MSTHKLFYIRPLYAFLETYNPKWNIAKRRDVRKNSSGGKSTIILLQVISMELYILITIKLCEKDVPETGARTIYIIQCKVYSTVYCSQVKDQLRSLLHSSMNFCRIIYENMLLNPKKISMCNQAWSQRDNPCNT